MLWLVISFSGGLAVLTIEDSCITTSFSSNENNTDASGLCQLHTILQFITEPLYVKTLKFLKTQRSDILPSGFPLGEKNNYCSREGLAFPLKIFATQANI